ncbi:hypothetical protein K4L44_07850 [Halosquirtibacter laminarini]|uniref:Uncharacterized protein n=1 Tax=Halosquirtibacter laminarini TaxID=3374600 RepID=A0AC61NML0_9BACT|nr:hypothetical protein K4L44_07850 [Prolixibacteraceae bacterium]
MMKIEQIKALSEQGKLDEALSLIQEAEDNETLSYKMLEGEILYKMQKWGDALNLFEEIYATHKNKEAKVYCQMIQSILGYYNPDMLNP